MTWPRPSSARHSARSTFSNIMSLDCSASPHEASGAGSMAIAASRVVSASCFACWPPERLRSPRSNRPPSLSPPGQTAAPNLNRLLPFSSSRRRHRPPWCAPRQPPSPTQVSLPLRRSSRLPLGPAAGRVATLGTLIFISVAIQLPRGPTANTTAPWPTWRRGLGAGMAPTSGSSLNGATSGQKLRVPKVPTMLLHPSPCPSRQREPQTVDPFVERLIGDLIAATACLFAQGLGECWARGKMNGQMSVDTQERGRVLIAGLLEPRNGTAGKMDFDAVARSHGVRVLKDRYGQAVSDRTINSLVNAALEVLGRIA